MVDQDKKLTIRKVLRKTTTYEEIKFWVGFNEDGTEREESEVLGIKTVTEIISLDGSYKGDELKEKEKLEREKRSD
jgi:hypothetical protein